MQGLVRDKMWVEKPQNIAHRPVWDEMCTTARFLPSVGMTRSFVLGVQCSGGAAAAALPHSLLVCGCRHFAAKRRNLLQPQHVIGSEKGGGKPRPYICILIVNFYNN